MKKQLVYGRLNAGLLVLVFAASWSSRMVHSWCMHHAHAEAPVCVAAHQGTAKHIHDERYNPDDCSLCAFIFSIPELPALPAMPLAPAVITGRILLTDTAIFLPADIRSGWDRGPPIV